MKNIRTARGTPWTFQTLERSTLLFLIGKPSSWGTWKAIGQNMSFETCAKVSPDCSCSEGPAIVFQQIMSENEACGQNVNFTVGVQESLLCLCVPRRQWDRKVISQILVSGDNCSCIGTKQSASNTNTTKSSGCWMLSRHSSWQIPPSWSSLAIMAGSWASIASGARKPILRFWSSWYPQIAKS